ncbi:hypothetical protein Hanom_Chr08g00703911 [Helianthus anomalus]
MSEKAMLTEEEPLNKNGPDNNNNNNCGKLRFITSSGAVIVPDAKPFISTYSTHSFCVLFCFVLKDPQHNTTQQ